MLVEDIKHARPRNGSVPDPKDKRYGTALDPKDKKAAEAAAAVAAKKEG